MSARNRFVSNIEASKLYLEAIIEMKFYEIKSDHMKKINSLHMKNHPSNQTTPPYLLNTYLKTATSGKHKKRSKI